MSIAKKVTISGMTALILTFTLTGCGGCEAEKMPVQKVLPQQRKEYVLAGAVPVRTKLTESTYDDSGECVSRRVEEYDKNGNEIRTVYYGAGDEVSGVCEYQYDEKGNRTEYKYIAYDSLGDIDTFSHETWAYDENGRETEYISYGEDGEAERKTKSEYDAGGNQIKHIEYDGNDKIAEWTEREYDAAGNEIKFERYNERGNAIRTGVRDYDGNGNQIRYTLYDDSGYVIIKEEYQYDKDGNEVEHVDYYDERTIKYRIKTEYDENGNEVKYISYHEDGTVSLWNEYEYNKDGNVIQYTSYDSEGGIRYREKREYDEDGREICGSDNSDGVVTRTWEYEYDESGSLIKAVYISYDYETGEKAGQTIDEFAYDENGNMTKYACTNDAGSGRDSGRGWERAYDEDGRETAFYFYEDEKGISYRSRTEYGENGLAVRYIGCDGDDNVLVEKETEYDVSGNVIKEGYYDADGNLTQYYENEYDESGSLIRQARYKDGVLRAEKQMEYAYHILIGDIARETAEDTDNDTTPEIFARFLNGQETIRYCAAYNSMNEGRIVRETITDLIDFAYWKDEPLKYALIDMTGDGIEELVIDCGSSNLYVIQNEHGILKVICSAVGGNYGVYLVKYHGRAAVCCNFGGHVGGNEEIYYFFDKKGKKEIVLNDYQNFEEDGTESRGYSMYDNDSFEYRDICRGEYENIMNGMLAEPEVCWQKLEEPVYGND